MSTMSLPSGVFGKKEPRVTALVVGVAASTLTWLSQVLAKWFSRPSVQQKAVAELLALAARYERTQPSLADDLRAAAMMAQH